MTHCLNYFKRILLASFLGITFFANANAFRIDHIDFTSDFREEFHSSTHNYLKYFYFILSDKPEDVVFPSNVKSLGPNAKYENIGIYSPIRLHRYQEFSDTETKKLYYGFYHNQIMVEKGSVDVTPELIKSSTLQINPMEFCKKIILKSPTGIDGKLLRAHFSINPMKILPSYIQSLNYAPIQVDEKNIYNCYWAEKGKEFPYFISADGPYFVKEGIYKTDFSDQPDTLTVDFRQAKKVSIGVKDINGKPIDLRFLNCNYPHTAALTFANLICTGHTCYEQDDITLSHKMYYDIPVDKPVYSLDFYAFPGSYISEYLTYNRNSDFLDKNGLHYLHQLMVIKENSSDIHFDFDYSKYLTIRVDRNIESDFSKLDFSLTNKDTNFQNPINQLVNCYQPTLNKTFPGFVVKGQDENGLKLLKIWAPQGYEFADFSGIIGLYRFKIPKLNLNQTKEYTLNIPDLYQVNCIVPKILSDFESTLHYNDIDLPLKKDSTEEKPQYSCDDFDLTDTLSIYTIAGENNFYYDIQNDRDTILKSKVKKVQVTKDSTKVFLPLGKAAVFDVIYDNLTADLKVNFEGNNDQPLLAAKTSIKDGNYQQLLYFFKHAGKYRYHVSGSHLVPISLQLTVNDESTLYQDIVPYTDFYLLGFAKNGQDTFTVKNSTWTNEQGKQTSFSFPDIVNDQTYVYSLAGNIECTLEVNNAMTCSPAYRCHINMNQDQIFDVNNDNSEVTFMKGDNPRSLFTTNTEGEQTGDVKIYLLKNPIVDSNEPLLVQKGKNSNKIGLLSGLYCAEDNAGKKVYFELPDGKKSSITIDFDNPPVPPTGIEEIMMNPTAPTTYYDLSGRQLNAKQKGVNIIKREDGKIHKILVK